MTQAAQVALQILATSILLSNPLLIHPCEQGGECGKAAMEVWSLLRSVVPLPVLPSLRGKHLTAAHHPAIPPGMCSGVSYELTHPVFLSTDGKLFHVFGIFSSAVVNSCKLMLSISLSHT